jgi:cytochrome c oxidase assembly protein subunit 15
MSHSAWVRAVAVAAFSLCLGVVVLGAYVRLSDAGLGCPDWPGCYGHLSPAGAAADERNASAPMAGRPLEIGKAWCGGASASCRPGSWLRCLRS